MNHVLPRRVKRRARGTVRTSGKETDAGLSSRRAASKGETVSHRPLVSPARDQ